MFQVFSRSFKGLNLSPGERAAMKLIEGWLLTAVGAGVGLVYQQLAVGRTDPRVIVPPAIGAAVLSVALSVKKFYAAQSDLPLPAPSLATRAPDPVPIQPPAGQVPLSELKLQPGQTVQAPIPPSPIDPSVSMAAFSTAQMPAVTPPVQP